MVDLVAPISRSYDLSRYVHVPAERVYQNHRSWRQHNVQGQRKSSGAMLPRLFQHGLQNRRFTDYGWRSSWSRWEQHLKTRPSAPTATNKSAPAPMQTNDEQR
ncbi:hypothetical protein KCP76_05345 [Salmonella enterica subsp. enterica serovar Weltevreden]|nr:hypothetical protein KCP76_05345 [Salmonella enterica subsp. enterica serovar Weltevreden]